MRAALRMLVTAQERYFAANQTYSNDLAALRGASDYDPGPNVTVTVTAASREGWSATARHRLLPGKSCVDWVGSVGSVQAPRTDAQGRSGESGAVVCDDP